LRSGAQLIYPQGQATRNKDLEMTSPTALSGIFPIAPTPFNPDGSLDPEGQRRVLDCMID